MTKVAVIGTIRARPGKGDDLASALGGIFGAVNEETGTELYIVHRVDGDPDTVVFYELYADEEAFQTHRKSDARRSVGVDVRDLVVGPPEITKIFPSAAKGVMV